MRKSDWVEAVFNETFSPSLTHKIKSIDALITEYLVPEVRREILQFYGSLHRIEARYPGLDYSFPPHRMRLSRFRWHFELFQVFDKFKLTEAEINDLCRWEGTKYARQLYEAQEGVKVRDTTAQSIQPASPLPLPSIEVHYTGNSVISLDQDLVVSATDGTIYPSTRDEASGSWRVTLNDRILEVPSRNQGGYVQTERCGHGDMAQSILREHL
ncbi:hypothetical protein N7499_003741 [Penicillium canescens]|uniref:Uncharacterized protein n=1 Tax=Penicillium canescens TaxID=5083 RepID=A0AAD6I546_PENCN|nr:uncharacterized protein N7446_014083 [Penicillium canescens]KAJ6018462.1 hypothetical protein N7522_001926 [Penicillium canescens]KAJ6034100.1 hypothetical protein N7460_009917 [Penicillium canescens]KAJ6039335.1 hypothetical protein N7446_014083 [Penicillium canescens]KAJ6066175.1 hypothetical protein N7444_000304 [Penicillium canescens]KAJ6091027.1 hypothetical protein N7499_003741 [Penicillium canescens]